MDEFFKQGDREKELGLPVSPMNDRERVVVSKSQTGFISLLVEPLFSAYSAFDPNATFLDEALDQLKKNASAWEVITAKGSQGDSSV